MTRKLDEFVDLARQVFQDTGVQDQITQFRKIDDMMDCNYELPDALQDVSWLQGRKFVSTAPADAVNAATRAFADREPNISVQPFSSIPEEYARVERLETGLKWELENMNSKGKQPVHWQIVHSAMRYCKIAVQTEYLPYMFKGRKKDNYVKAVLSSSKFNWRVHHPGTVFAQDGPYGLAEFVVSRTKRTANWLVSKFGKDNKGVRKMLADMADGGDELAAQLNQTLWYYDVTTWEDRAMWASFTDENASETNPATGFEFLREDHNLPFMPWIVVDNKDPILKSVVDAELWENSNVIRTMAFAKAVDMVEQPQLWIQTLSGDLADVARAEGGVNEPLVTSTTTNVKELRPPQLDPQIETIKQMSESEIFRTSVAQILASVQEIGKTATYSTVNAMLQAALTQLVLAKNAAERAETLAFKQSLQWIDYSKIPLELYRSSNKTVGDITYDRGQEIIITEAMDVDEIPAERRSTMTPVTETVYMSVTLQPRSITDKQAEQTMAINQVERLGASKAMVYDEYGFGDYAQHETRRKQEDLTDAEVQAEGQRILMAPQEEAAQRQMQMQQQAQYEQQVAAENARLQQQSAAFAGTQGFDFRNAGGPSPAGATPGNGREQLTGQAFNGEGIA